MAWAMMNGERRPLAEVGLAPWDAGVVWGATVTERMRTLGGRWLDAEVHWRRFFDGCERVGIILPVGIDELGRAADELLALHAPGDWSAVSLATPGPVVSMAPPDTPTGPTWITHLVPIDAAKFAEPAELELHPSAMPSRLIPSDIKHRSRLHWWLAERGSPGGVLYFDPDTNCLRETSAANVMFVAGGVISTPGAGVLPGTMLTRVRRAAVALGYEWRERVVGVGELGGFTEVMLTNTTFGVRPVRRIGGVRFEIGACYAKLRGAWGG